LTFIESQFPVSKLSKESYKERKAVAGQTLTATGRWWGRKPLILCRAAILGLLMPVSDDPKRDREIFLKLLTMDEDGLLRRKTKSIPLKRLYQLCTKSEQNRYFTEESNEKIARYRRGVSREEKDELQEAVFLRLSYDDKLEYCDRPEQIDGPADEAWREINAHLGTSAKSLPELVRELGEVRFGHVPRVGDAFCGGGSVPFEAARLGCEAYGSDLNPVAALLTWAALNIVGGGPKVGEEVRKSQQEVYAAVDKQITEWGIEHNEKGWRADAYLYCCEVRDPESGWMIPLAPSWVIGDKTHAVAKLVPDNKNKRFEIEIQSRVSEQEMKAAKEAGTAKDSSLVPPPMLNAKSTPITVVRGDRDDRYGLRMWENDDLVPRPDDVFQERLYCIRWVETYLDEEGEERTRRHYAAPTKKDLEREAKVLELLRERFAQWQANGYIPSRNIEPGDETTRLLRERGWTQWHHLFNPRQLLLCGLFSQLVPTGESGKANLLLLGRVANNNSRLSRWKPSQSGGIGGVIDTFSNQALNTLSNYGCRAVVTHLTLLLPSQNEKPLPGTGVVRPADCRNVDVVTDMWITDPPYADAINYHELGEFFLAWYEKHLVDLFPKWYLDSRCALAVTGSDENFRKSMVDCYKNLAAHMPDNGLQIVMFTHQDAGVWADLALILWASGLRVTAAWCIVTETDSAQKEGNYVQGTVLLVLRKQSSEAVAFLDELIPQVEDEVKRQLDSMLKLDDQEDPNFSDTDYQLAAYAAALRVLTRYKAIEDIDISRELNRVRERDERNPIERIIEDAVHTACDFLVPRGFDPDVWRLLTAPERFYLKGLEIESHGEFRNGVYQELARGFGLTEYKPMLASNKANQTRLKTATEFGTKELGSEGFGSTLVRHSLFATREVIRTEDVQDGKNWIRNEVKGYWQGRKALIAILQFLASVGGRIEHWNKDAEAAALVAGVIENDHI
jgi:putative DNA methylase